MHCKAHRFEKMRVKSELVGKFLGRIPDDKKTQPFYAAKASLQ